MLLSLAGCPLCATKLSYIKTNFLLTLFTVGGPQPFIIVNQEEDHCQLSIFVRAYVWLFSAYWSLRTNLGGFMAIWGDWSYKQCNLFNEGGGRSYHCHNLTAWPVAMSASNQCVIIMPGATWMIHDNSWQILEYLGLRRICWVRLKILEYNQQQQKCIKNLMIYLRFTSFTGNKTIQLFNWKCILRACW